MKKKDQHRQQGGMEIGSMEMGARAQQSQQGNPAGNRQQGGKNASRDQQWRDVEAGAYYRLSPSLRVGGSVGLSGDAAAARRVPDGEKPAPRVRLETTFRF